MGIVDILFSGKSKRQRDLDKTIVRLSEILNSEEEQNKYLASIMAEEIVAAEKNEEEFPGIRLPSDVSRQILSGAAVDVIAGAAGEFGRDVRNPIPCNGPFGEWTYLSRLHVKKSGHKMFFHKIAVVDQHIDQFELVDMSGRFWDYLYMDMYHPRKSRKCPSGYEMDKRVTIPRGITSGACPDFPEGLYALIQQQSEQFLQIPIADKDVDRIDLQQARSHQHRD